MSGAWRIVAAMLLVAIAFSIAGAQLAPWPAGPTTRADRVRSAVRAELASPEYRLDAPEKSALERIGDSIAAPIKRFFEWLGGKLRGLAPGAPSGTFAYYVMIVLYVLVIAGAVVGVAYLIVVIVRHAALRKQGRKRKPVVSHVSIDEPDPDVEPEELIEAARRHAEIGDWRAAYRSAFTATLVRLDRLGAIRFERHRTNGDYVRALRSRPSLHSLFRPAAREFDARWYGRMSVSAEDYERMVAVYGQVRGVEA